MNRGSWSVVGAALAGALALAASAQGAERKPAPDPAGRKLATAEPAEASAPAQPGPVTATDKAAARGCVKVKVVYAGYGEAARAGCAPTVE